MDEIEKFAKRRKLNAADTAELRRHHERGSWPDTAAYLKTRGIDVTRLQREDAFLWMAPDNPAAAVPPMGHEPAPDADAAVDRIKAILQSPEAKERQQAAQHIALSTSLSVESARAMLLTVPLPGASPAPKAPAPARVGRQEPQALVSCYPPAAAHPRPDKTGKPSWGAVLARMSGGAS